MDLGIRGKHALVCAASKGLGRACALALAREGVAVTLVARGAEALEATAAEIRAATGVAVATVAADIVTPKRVAPRRWPPARSRTSWSTTPAGRRPAIFATGTRDDWLAALDANMLTPIELIKATVDGMIARKFGRIVNITSGAVKAPIDVLGLSNGARSGLTGFVAGLARKTVAHNVTINNLLPGFFDTDRMAAVIGGQAKAKGHSATRPRWPSARHHPGRPHRRSRGIRRRLRLAVFGAGRLHHRAELAARRRRLSGDVLGRDVGRVPLSGRAGTRPGGRPTFLFAQESRQRSAPRRPGPAAPLATKGPPGLWLNSPARFARLDFASRDGVGQRHRTPPGEPSSARRDRGGWNTIGEFARTASSKSRRWRDGRFACKDGKSMRPLIAAVWGGPVKSRPLPDWASGA